MSYEILHLPSWANSAAGRPIELWSSLHKDERPLLFIGGVHGDEPEGVRLAQDFLIWLRKNSHLNLKSWILIPCLNIDGFSTKQRTNSAGVDLNRNFPSMDWSSEAKSERYYPGPSAASEPEVKALVELISKTHPELILHFHSWQPCVVFTGPPGQKAAELISPNSDYPAREDIGYPTPGSLGQYGWSKLQIPVICLEEQEKSPLENAWINFGPGLQKLVSRNIIL